MEKHKKYGFLTITRLLFIGIVIMSGCIEEEKEIKYTIHSGAKSIFKYPNDWKNMNPSELGISQTSDIKYTIKMQKDNYAFIIFESEETERVSIDKNQLDLYIANIKQGYDLTGSGHFSVLDKTIVSSDEAMVDCKTKTLHIKIKFLNCEDNKFNTLLFASYEDKWNKYESMAQYSIDSFKCT